MKRIKVDYSRPAYKFPWLALLALPIVSSMAIPASAQSPQDCSESPGLQQPDKCFERGCQARLRR